MTRLDKLERLSLETLFSQILEFDGKAKAKQIKHHSAASFLGKLLVLPANVKLDWKGIARYKLAYFASTSVTKEKRFNNSDDRCSFFATFILQKFTKFLKT